MCNIGRFLGLNLELNFLRGGDDGCDLNTQRRVTKRRGVSIECGDGLDIYRQNGRCLAVEILCFPHDINTINKSILHIHIHIYIERERERVRERERERTKFLEYYLLHP